MTVRIEARSDGPRAQRRADDGPARAESLDDVLSLVVRNAAELLQTDVCSLFLVDHDTRSITHRHAIGIDEGELRSHDYEELAAGLSGLVWRTGSAVRSDDIGADHRNESAAAARAAGRDGVQIVVAPIDLDGEVVGTISVLNYEPDRRLGEAERRSLAAFALQAELAIRTARLALELGNQRDDLKAAMEAQEELIARVNHELRTPLAYIVGAGELLEDPSRLDASQLREVGLRIRRNGVRLQGLVENLLSVQAHDTHESIPRPQPIDLAEHLRERRARDGCLRTATCEIEPGSSVLMDPGHLDRVLTAIVENALEYGSPPIEISASTTGHRTVVRVRDHGDGVAHHLRANLFDRFSQGDSGLTRRSTGLGLGLAIARELVAANGGTMSYADGDPGAVFAIDLPAGPRPL